ncbi:hypothetical protein DL95DRAFT_425149 [Leptodontidium sp. 2 PMI_412]|nr:hypothetical protein DL95DRAFT_425149 [Leptodontidium sp. 2 PMI_412]
MEISPDRAQWEEHLFCYFTGSTGEVGGDFDFTIMCNTKRLIVTVSPSLDPDDKARLLLSQYREAGLDDEDQIQDEIINMIFEAGWQIFAQLAPSPENRAASFPTNLCSDLYPETFYFRLAVNHHLYLATKDGFDWPKYPARNIVVTKKLMGTGYIAKVTVDGQDMCCKIGTMTSRAAVQREYECLQKIAMTADASSIRAPRLFGFVVDDDENTIGILQDFIPHEFTLGRVKGGLAIVSHEQRKRWAEQIRRTVEQLHEVGVVWGDGKPDNVLVHAETYDCWLVDFGGSWTDGWVDAELQETWAGDKQAVVKIMDFLTS